MIAEAPSPRRGLHAIWPLLVVVAACGKESFQVTSQLLTDYEALAHPRKPDTASPTIDCYLDFSTGMGEGMRATAAINEKLKNFLGGRKVSCYKVGAIADPPPVALDSPDANFVNLDNFKEPGSKLKVAVDRMTAQKGGVSFFITDFERVEDVSLRQNLPGAPAPHPIDASAWAQNEFREWLLAGNQIDIFAVPYQKPDYWFDKTRSKTYTNWIYTIVLTPRAIVRDSIVFKASVGGFLQEEYRRNPPPGANHFVYNVDAFRIEQSPKDPNGNANDNVIVEEATTDAFEQGFEYYKFASPDLTNFAHDATQSDKRIINKVRISSQVPFLTDVMYGIKVYDVTQALADLDAVNHQGPPEVKEDVETGKADTIANKPVLPTFEPGTPAETVFDVVYNSATNELGIKLNAAYAGTTERTIYKVDVTVASSTIRESADADTVLALQYGGGYRIRALGESIKLAVRDVVAHVNENVLHTFYIEITP